MSKRKKLKKSYSNWKNYSDYQYKGIIGWLMKLDHKKQENQSKIGKISEKKD